MRNSSRTVLIVLLLAIAFALDLQPHWGVAAGILYVTPVLLTLWFRRALAPLLAAAGSTILLAAVFLFAEPQAGSIPNALTNRLLAAGAIWTTAALVVLFTRSALVAGAGARKQTEEQVREVVSLRTLTAGLLRRQEQERQRIARELHDGVNQMLAALSMELTALEDQVGDPDAARARLGSIEKRVAAISEEIRRVSHQLHPSVLEHAGFPAALRSHCREFGKQTGIQVKVASDNLPERIDPELSTLLFHFCREALQNVAKHSAATEVLLRVSGAAREVQVSITDNGKGFDIAGARSGGGLGLLSMSERARSVGGHFSIESGPQQGVTVTIRVPLAVCPPDSDRAADPSESLS